MELLKKITQSFQNIRANLFQELSTQDIKYIKSTHLFDSLGETSFNKLLKSLRYKIYTQGDLIFKEGTKGKDFYIITEGSVSVFTNDRHGKKIYLARLDEGAYFGEQSLMGHASKSRNASIEAITNTKLIVIKGKYFKDLINQDSELKKFLIQTRHKQLINNVVEAVPNYELFKQHFTNKTDTVLAVKKGTVIFNAGDAADSAYIILKGNIKIDLLVQGKNQIINLDRGDIFGELGILTNAPRVAAAVAAEDTELLKITAEEFKHFYKGNEQFQKLIDTLTQTYTLPNRGTVFQFVGHIDNQAVITTDFKLKNGRNVIASKSTDNTFIMIEKTTKPTKSFSHTRANGTKIEIGVTDDNYVKCVKVWGNWRYINNVCACILDQKQINQQMIADFTTNGVFPSDDLSQSETICVCMSISKDRIEDLIETGCNSLAMISEITGASTVCGSCRPRILTILGQDVWMPAILKKLHDHNATTSSFTVVPTEGVFNAIQPGEHIVVQLKIEDNWVERAYTISDLPKDNHYRITVKREANGLLSKWLATNDTSQVHIFVSQPQGNFKLIVEEPSPIICFAGGIGITPFITFTKALSKSRSQRSIHLIYIAPTEADFIFLDEFDELKKTMPNFKLTLWERKKSGYLSDETVASFIQDYNGASVFICGPEGFETSLIQTLKNIDFRTDKIFVERFTYANPIM